MSSPQCQAVLLTGVYGSGKTSVVAEMATVFEERGMAYAAMDLDWLGWFDVGWDDDEAHHGVMIANLEAVVRNYLDAGARFLMFALSIEHRWELDAIRSAIPCPLSVARIVAEIETIELRCAADPTTGRVVDLHLARTWLDQDLGIGFDDFAVTNDRPIRQVAVEVIAQLGW